MSCIDITGVGECCVLFIPYRVSFILLSCWKCIGETYRKVHAQCMNDVKLYLNCAYLIVYVGGWCAISASVCSSALNTVHSLYFCFCNVHFIIILSCCSHLLPSCYTPRFSHPQFYRPTFTSHVPFPFS